MDAEDAKDETPEMRLVKLICKRTNEQVAPGEHARCPYCFGGIADVESGRHRSFCNYDPEKDPVRFGFPEGGVRDETG